MLRILIDGYNLIHASREADFGWTDLSLEKAREALVNFLVTTRRPAMEEITVVFDGASGVGYPREATARGVTVVYSEPGTSADDVICRMVTESPNPRKYLVVSKDRQIRETVLAVGAQVVSPESFLERSQEEHEKRRRAGPAEPKEKYTGVRPSEVERWRKIFGFDDEEKK